MKYTATLVREAHRKLTGRIFCPYCQKEKPAETMRKVNSRWKCEECRNHK